MLIHIHVQIHKEVKLAVWLSIFRSIIFNTALKKALMMLLLLPRSLTYKIPRQTKETNNNLNQNQLCQSMLGAMEAKIKKSR